jgi:2-keto-4-pentenoate hydratase
LLEASALHHLAIEAEVAFRFGADATPVEMCAAIEVVDTRWQGGLQGNARAKLADFMVHGALVLGDWAPVREGIDWARQPCRVTIGAQAHDFHGSHVNVDPLAVLPGWMRHVHDVREGMVVTTGTWCGLLWATPEDTVTVAFDGIGEAVLRFG